jgi:5-methylcytosine-specific restriction endonuclease McrA
MFTCEVCRKPFYVSRLSRIKPPRFCSRECRINSNNKFVACLQCGEVFRVPAGDTIKGSRKFCSRACSNRYNQPKDPEKKSVFTCKWCGKQFTEWTYRKPSYCSNQCRTNYAAQQRGRQLYKPDSVRGRGMNWKKQSKLARQRDKYTCQVCGRNGWLDKFRVQVHHIIPYRLFNGDYERANDLSNLVSLCPSCHPKVESGTITLKRYSK